MIGDNLDISGSLPVERSEPSPSYTFAKHALFVPTLLMFPLPCVFFGRPILERIIGNRLGYRFGFMRSKATGCCI